jgi:hypothetical protein
MSRIRILTAVLAFGLASPPIAGADVVLDWNAIAMATLLQQGVNPFAQTRVMAMTQLAVFEAVNSITKKYQPYVGTVVAPSGARADAAAVAAAYRVLKTLFPQAANLDSAYLGSLQGIPDGTDKAAGIATGDAAAAQLIALRANDGSSPPRTLLPTSSEPGAWQLTAGCSSGVFYHWQNVAPFGVPPVIGGQSWLDRFRPEPPPSLAGRKYARDYAEVHLVGSRAANDSARPEDRTAVARLYALSSPAYVFNLAARQVATERAHSLTFNARALALLNMAANDSFVASFETKYYYGLWRPETAIPFGDADDNPRTSGDTSFMPLIPTPCFPSYPSNHASGSVSASEVLRRLYGGRGHAITVQNPAVPGIVLEYRSLRQITDDIDDARVYGGIHFRFDQDAGARLGRSIAAYVHAHNLRPVRKHGHDDRDEDDAEDDGDEQP